LPAGVKVPDPNSYPNGVNKKLFETLALYTICDPKSHKSRQYYGEPDAESTVQDASKWHPTRLPLGGPLKVAADQEGYTTFNVVISTLPEMTWTQFQIGVFGQVIHHLTPMLNLVALIRVETRRGVTFNDENTGNGQELEQQSLCTKLDELGQFLLTEVQLMPGAGWVEISDPQPVRGLFRDKGITLSSAIKNHTFSVKDKIVLAHTIAQAFWQLYASDLMRSVWTSDNIWFMHDDNEGTRGDKLPMKVYVAFDFSDTPQAVPEFLVPRPKDNLSHRLPHILALGILLLEIALGEVVREPGSKSISIDHIKANNKWYVLKDTQWDGFRLHMNHLIEAIHQCLNFNKVWRYSCPLGPGLETPIAARRNDSKSIPKLVQEKPPGIVTRRELLYEKVVKPLAYLASAFQEDSENVTYPYTDVTYILPCEEKGRTAKKFQPKKVLFGHDQGDNLWLDDLKIINGYLKAQLETRQEEFETESKKAHPSIDKAKPKGSSSVKVAILDTGYNQGMDFFKREGRADRIKWKDFVGTEPHGVDDHGHGSFMTQLVMESSPLADIFVVRIAAREEDLDLNNKRIVEVCKSLPLQD
jgi:hypothetical protein